MGKKMKLYSLAPGLIKNRAKVAYSYLKRLSHNRGMPIEVVVESTNHCNMKCPMCPRDQDNTMSTRGLGFMKMPVFRKVIDEVKEWAETVDLYLAGEPLLHPNIMEMINYCGKHGVRSALHTNASFLTEEKAKSIVDSPLSILDISFDGVTKETYEQIRVGGKYEETMRNIKHYLELKAKSPGRSPHTTIHMIYMEKNRHEIKPFLEKWGRAGVDEVRVKPFNKTGLSGERANLGAHSESLNNSGTKTRKPCFLLWRFFVVHWDGTVVPCCMDFIRREPLGNIMENPFEELWNGPPMKRLRTLHIEGKFNKIPLCKDCSVPIIGLPMLLASIFVDNTTIKKRFLPVIERFWILKKFKALKYFDSP